MIRLSQVFVVEGRYDKHRLKQIFDAAIFDIGGFGIFKDVHKLALLRRMAVTRGLIILTDSDGAGLVIRNYLKGTLSGRVYHAYIPALPGKERRKRRPGKAGLLGVEGMTDAVIIEAVRRSGALDTAPLPPENALTKADLYALGLSGRADSVARRLELCRRLELPPNLSSGSLLEVLNLMGGRQALDGMLEAGRGESHGDL